ncbi:MAG: pentapeptide repeat-containing protein [Candidatus Margulisiibacteriota bacterium]
MNVQSTGMVFRGRTLRVNEPLTVSGSRGNPMFRPGINPMTIFPDEVFTALLNRGCFDMESMFGSAELGAIKIDSYEGLRLNIGKLKQEYREGRSPVRDKVDLYMHFREPGLDNARNGEISEIPEQMIRALCARACGMHRSVYGPMQSLVEAAVSTLYSETETKSKIEGFNRCREQMGWIPLNLSGLDLSEMELTGIDLSGVNLSGVNLENSFLTYANLKGAVLYRTKAKNTFFNGSILSSVDFRNAELSNATFSDAVLTGADVWGAMLYNAVFSKNKPVGFENLEFARWHDGQFFVAADPGTGVGGVYWPS